jgi:hypothetical protein
MSWISDHYEKAALAGTLVAAVALGYTGFKMKSSVEKDFADVPKSRGPNNASINDGDKVALANSSFQIDQRWVQAEDGEGRPVDLFTGVPLFVDKKSPKKPVDLPKSDEVHPPIPNKWWIENRIDPGFGDSPQRDEDSDGFTNLEEFEANTDPKDSSKHPNLILKLAYLGDESVKWVLRPNGYPTPATPDMNFEYSDTKRVRVKNPAVEPIKPNTLFFKEDAAKEAKSRFKYLGFENRVEGESNIDFIKVEDQKHNKKGMVYEIPANFRADNVGIHAKYDRTAKLSLEALGLGGQEFKVEELTDFALPKDAESKRFRMIEVSPTRIVVRETLEDGSTKLHEIAKHP